MLAVEDKLRRRSTIFFSGHTGGGEASAPVLRRMGDVTRPRKAATKERARKKIQTSLN